MAYCTVADLRAEGVTTAQASDDRLLELIPLATDYLDAICGWWFEPRQKLLTLDGNGLMYLPLPLPLIEASMVVISGVSVEDFVIYGWDISDDRYVPKLFRSWGWPKGDRNIQVTGTWGFVDLADGVPTVPRAIKRAAMRLVIRELALLGDEAGQEARKRVRIISETTDGHSYSLARLAMFPEWTGDPDIDQVIALYRRPSIHVEAV